MDFNDSQVLISLGVTQGTVRQETATLTVLPGTLRTILAAAMATLERHGTMGPVQEALDSAMDQLATLTGQEPGAMYRDELVLIKNP